MKDEHKERNVSAKERTTRPMITPNESDPTIIAATIRNLSLLDEPAISPKPIVVMIVNAQ